MFARYTIYFKYGLVSITPHLLYYPREQIILFNVSIIIIYSDIAILSSLLSCIHSEHLLTDLKALTLQYKFNRLSIQMI